MIFFFNHKLPKIQGLPKAGLFRFFFRLDMLQHMYLLFCCYGVLIPSLSYTSEKGLFLHADCILRYGKIVN